MKTFIPILFFMLFAFTAMGQGTVNATLTQQPCNNDGIITTTFSGFASPVTVNYYISNTVITHSGVTGTTDVLNSYNGSTVYIQVTDGTTYGGADLSAPPFTVNVNTTSATCPALGTATANVSGGVAPYTYQWVNPTTSTVISTGNPASLPGGGYELQVTDASGCVSYSDSAYVYVAPGFQFGITPTAANCTNGSAAAGAVTGGTSPYSYLWSNGATTPSITGLTAGSYNLTITDANGCAATSYTNVPQSVTIGANITTTPATCTQNDGAVTSFGSGGVPPYTYHWSNGATTQSQSNLPSGNYSVVVKDANNCSGNGAAYVSSTTPITATYTTTTSLCTSPNGSATLTISGGATPYTISWGTSPAQSGTTASNLAAGTYAFHITDANGCVRNGTVTINPVNIITLNVTTGDATCTQANGSLNVVATGGTAPYTYLWSNSATTSSINSLAAGTYTITVTDAAGCSKTKYEYIDAYSPVNVDLSATPATCIYNTDGSVHANVYGGATPYTYIWDNGQTTATATNLGAGYYGVYVTDANGCTASNSTSIGYNATNNSCYCTITGKVYDDANSNCTPDAGENGIQNIQIYCSGIGYAYTDANGVYSFQVPTGSYTLSENVLGYYPLQSCQTNNIAVSATAASGCSQTYNFANSVASIHDMHISTWNYNFPIPGFTYNQVSVISNEGTVNESSYIASYKTDGQLNAPTFSPSLFTGSGNYYSLTGALAPGTSEIINTSYSVPANIPLNTSLVFTDSTAYTAPISNWLNDYSPWDNVNYFTATTVGSYDPNFIEVSPKGTGAPGYIPATDSVLEYMVHFQNVGTYQAQNITVIDTLDPNLNWASLRPIYSSAPCAVTMNENGVVKYTFSNINLVPEITNAPASNAMFTYTIHIKDGLAPGTQFNNRAAVYFDYNEPVITNGTRNTLNAPTNIGNIAADNGFSVYPNPAGNKVNVAVSNVENIADAQISIYDLSGRSLLQQPVSLHKGAQTISVNTQQLAAGLYFIQLSNGSKLQTQKLTIIR